MKFLSNIKNVRKNWKTIQSSPYASLYFKYKTTLITIILFSLFIGWTIIKLVMSSGQSGYMGIITKCFTLGIGALIIFKAFQTLIPLKKAMEPYKKNKDLINHTETNAKVEINDILDQFNEDGKRIGDTHQGKKKLNLNKQKK
jgi:uncharacterized membrane protein YcjF (UPF0283 family)